ncbi:MAG TPA: hypothetical protein VED63_04015 [Acidimicrobiales bacterium]|nr:hypothetical protein [Acidimicrobiales bacterium]
MDTLAFSVNYDYRCPFARNAHEHVVEALRGGAAWDVEFVPFSLTQVHAEPGDPPVWEDPARADTLLAIEAGLVVRDGFPDLFLDVHLGMFAARHDEGRDLRQTAVVRDVLAASGVDADAVLTEVERGWPREMFRKAHETSVGEHHVFGVPTFVASDSAAFVRLMTRPGGDTDAARVTIEHVLGLLVDHPELNEFKHTSIDR